MSYHLHKGRERGREREGEQERTRERAIKSERQRARESERARESARERERGERARKRRESEREERERERGERAIKRGDLPIASLGFPQTTLRVNGCSIWTPCAFVCVHACACTCLSICVRACVRARARARALERKGRTEHRRARGGEGRQIRIHLHTVTLVFRSHAPEERFVREFVGGGVLELEDLARGRVAEVHNFSVCAERYCV